MVRRALILACLLCGLPAAAQDAPASGVVTRAPELLRQVSAPFPEELAAAGVGGVVLMEVDLGADGKVMEVRVVESAGQAFDEAALFAVRQFEFSPAEVDGQPSPVRILYRYEFLFRPEEEPAPQEGQPAAPVVNFSGRILQRGTRRPLAGAWVVVELPGGLREASTDPTGGFELSDLPPGTHPVQVRAQDHSVFKVTETFEQGEATLATYYLRPLGQGGFETVVRGEREKREVSKVTLRQEEIRLMPGTQGDALRVVQNLPGVARAPYSAGLLIVRGGKTWDTRVYVDHTYVPHLFHFGGLYATFNSQLLEDLDFSPGNFSAAYGRNIGGLVRASSRTPSKEGVHGYLDLNLVDVSAMVEAPLGEHWSLAVAGRRSHIDVLLPYGLEVFAPTAKDVLSFTLAPRYRDYQVRVERRKAGSKDRLSLTLFGSVDELALVLKNPAYDPEGRAEFETLMMYNRLSFNWEKVLSPRTRMLTHLSTGYDRFDFSLGHDLYLKTRIFPWVGRQAFTFEVLPEVLQLSAGLDLMFVPYRSSVQTPPFLRPNQVPDPFLSRQLLQEDDFNASFGPSAYLEAVWSPHPAVRLIPSIRADYELIMNDGWLDPRLSGFFQLTPSTTLKAGVGLYRQPPDYRQGLLSATFGNPDLLPEGAIHYAVGGEQQLTPALHLDVQLYYKSLFNQAVPTVAEQLRFESTGRGRAYGVEVLLRQQLSRNLFAWLAYSLSRAEQHSWHGTGRIERSPFDQPHNLVALASYKLPYDFVLGARVRYSSGPLNTPYLGAVYDANGNYHYPLPGEPFSRRLPPFFQLDVRVDKRFVYKTWALSVYADVLNATNRQNVEGVSYSFDYSQERYLTGLPILPALGMRGEF